MNPYNFSLLFFAFCSLFMGLLIRLKHQDLVAKRYFIFSLIVGLWGSFLSIVFSQNASYETALLCVRFSSMAAVFIPVTWFHFALVYSGRLHLYKRILPVFYGISFFVDCFGFSSWFVPSVYGRAGFVHYGQLGPIYHIFTFMFFTIVPLGFFQVYRKIQQSSGKEKFQAKGLFISTLAGFLGGGLTFLPSYEIPLPQYGLFLMPAHPFAMAYFVMRESLFDLEQLAEAAQRAKLAAIGTLAASINHEIKNPLYVIQGLAGSFLANREEGIYTDKDQMVDKASEIFKKVGEHSTRAMEIMKGFALFAKQTVKENPQSEAISLNESIDGILPLVSHELDIQKINFMKSIPSDIPNVRANRRHLEEIFFNLIVNACQAIKNDLSSPNASALSPPNASVGGRIEISAAQHNGSVHVTVQDNGPGIPQKKLKQIFEPFYTTKEDGTGLGLYIIKQLVEKNGGKIFVNSQLGKGTKFILSFNNR